MIYGYARVSTKGQERYGNSLPEQAGKTTPDYREGRKRLIIGVL